VSLVTSNLSDGNGGYTTEAVYEFSKDGEAIGTGAIQSDGDGGISISHAEYGTRDEMQADMATYKKTGEVHKIMETIPATDKDRDLNEKNEFKGDVHAGGLENGTIKGGKLDIGDSPTLAVSSPSTMNGVTDSGSAVASTSLKRGMSKGNPDNT
jgi:hypothetical protein